MTTNTDDCIHLRALEPDDLDLLYDVENDTSLWQTGSTNMPYSKQILRNYILAVTGDIYTDKQLRLIVELRDNGGKPETAVIGIADLTNFDPCNNRAEVGIVILDNYRRRGYALQVIDRLCGYARARLHLHQLYAVIPVDNLASGKLFGKCGFAECARMKDWLYDGEVYKEAVMVQKIL